MSLLNRTFSEAELKGEKGDPGPSGPKGDTGSQGATGQTGPKGDTGAAGAAGAKGDIGPAGPKGDAGAAGTNATPLKITNVTGSGTVALTGYASVLAVIPVPTWSGSQMIVGAASAVTKDGFTATVMRSRATLLLSAGPFEAAPAGTSASFVVIGT